MHKQRQESRATDDSAAASTPHRPLDRLSGSAQRSKRRFLFSTPKPFQPSPTGSKSSSAETTVTQSSLEATSCASWSSSTSPALPTPPPAPGGLSPSVVSSPISDDGEPAGLNVSRRPSDASAFVRAIRESFRSRSGASNKQSLCDSPAPSSSWPPPVKTRAATTLLADEQERTARSDSKAHSERYIPTLVPLGAGTNYTNSEKSEQVSSEEPDHTGSVQPKDHLDMKRHLREMEQAAPDSAYSTLPSGLGNLCLASLCLPFLLFDSSENLIFANEAAISTIPSLASTSASATSASGEDTANAHTGTSTHRRRKTDGRAGFAASSTRNDPVSRVNSDRLSSGDIFSHYAYDDIGLATAKLKRAPDARQFSLSRTLEDRSAVGQSYDYSSDKSTSSTRDKHDIDRGSRLDHTDAQQPHASFQNSQSSAPPTLAHNGGVAGDVQPSRIRSSKTKTTTDGRFRRNYPKQCQPFLHLCGTDTKTWWRTTLSRVDQPDGESSTEYYYSVLLFQPIVYELSELTPCDDVSSIRSLSTAATRPPLARTPSDSLVVPTNLEGLTEQGEDSSYAIPPDFYKAAVECMPQILFTSGRDGIVSYLNPQWYAYTGWDMKMPSREMWADVFHPSDVPTAVDQYSEAIRSGSDFHLHYRVKNKDGQYRWMIARGRCIRDDGTGKITGFVCTLTDGQDLIDAQKRAVQTQQYISTVLQASAITLIVVDTARKVVMFEGYIEALDKLGVTGEDAIGRLLEDAWPDLECAEQAQAMLAQSDDNTVLEREFATAVGPSNFRYRITPLYDSKPADPLLANDSDVQLSRKCTGLAIVCTDTSAIVRAEKALVQSQKERAELAAREEAAREASRLKTIFVTSLSHEIRTPISGMLGISELLLRDESLSPKHRSLVQKQLQAGEVLLQLVSMVLDLGKMEANKLDLENEPFAVSDLMKDLDIFVSLADAKNIYFERVLDVREDYSLTGDRLRVAQVLSNFISNSVKFTSQGGITLRVEQLDRESHCLMIFHLEDTGTGIDEETLPHLFKPFHQGNVTIARRFGGSGLGLSIAKTLTELMGGTVTLTSSLGIGTTVRLEIPFHKPSQSLQRSQSRSNIDVGVSSAPVQDVTGLPVQIRLADRREDVSILIAEDNLLLQEVYSALARKMRFGTIRVVEDGFQAIEEIERDLPHVVLMDIEMPRMNGPDAVRVIRSHAIPAIRAVKIIALTANAVSGDKERFLAMGMDMYLSKPVRALKLEEAIIDCLQDL